jgi:hypothetical protein
MSVRIREVHKANTRLLAMDGQMSIQKHDVKTAVHFPVDKRIVEVLRPASVTLAGGFVSDPIRGRDPENRSTRLSQLSQLNLS